MQLIRHMLVLFLCSARCRKTPNTFVWQTKTVLWIKDGETDASIAVFQKCMVVGMVKEGNVEHFFCFIHTSKHDFFKIKRCGFILWCV